MSGRSPVIPAGRGDDGRSRSARSTSTTSSASRRPSRGATTLYNTYWVRFAHGTDRPRHWRWPTPGRSSTRPGGPASSGSSTSASPTRASPPLIRTSGARPWWSGRWPKSACRTPSSGRPSCSAGDGVLLNNIAWLLRHCPVFAVGGRGDYRIRAIHVDDLADLCVAVGGDRHDSVIDAVGPERPTFLELVDTIRTAVGSRTPDRPRARAVVPALARQPRARPARRPAHPRGVPGHGCRTGRHRRSGHRDDVARRLAG